ncbi:TetR/AcrR family transcriptional regulator [Amycolatopsis nigrescens]|uniref:TetR/AcrR family transcriptional regulator n=1 Tax=Amycolatopsis nigrescens TaxID=381445 RepID=UPI0003A1B09D|nr:TetR family transcriptional regulator [Amycolatopsis nigrescens]
MPNLPNLPKASKSPEPPERPARERANAAKTHAELLAVAESLVNSRGVAALSMNAVAAAADVGVGTVYRRFGDQGGLVEALMIHREQQLQDAMRAGPPPLGPGAPAPERIRAFLHAYADVLDTYAPLMAAAEATMTPGRRFRTGPYEVHRQHLAALLTEAGRRTRADYLADALLAPLAAGLFTLQRHEEGNSLESIKDGLDALVSGLDR